MIERSDDSGSSNQWRTQMTHGQLTYWSELLGIKTFEVKGNLGVYDLKFLMFDGEKILKLVDKGSTDLILLRTTYKLIYNGQRLMVC